jgi:hypothetical protein
MLVVSKMTFSIVYKHYTPLCIHSQHFKTYCFLSWTYLMGYILNISPKVINTKFPTYMHNVILENDIVHVSWKFCINYMFIMHGAIKIKIIPKGLFLKTPYYSEWAQKISVHASMALSRETIEFHQYREWQLAVSRIGCFYLRKKAVAFWYVVTVYSVLCSVLRQWKKSSYYWCVTGCSIFKKFYGMLNVLCVCSVC